MNGFWAFLCVLQLLIGLVVAIGFINGLLVVSRSLRGRQATEAESDASFELDNRVAAAAEALACRGTEVREAAALLLGLMGRHPDGARAIKMAQRGLREAGAGVSSHAQPGVAEDVQRAAPASGEAAWRTRAETVAVSRGSAGSSVDSTAQAIVRRWFDIDNITLLLYLGAGLIVIAAGIFVGSSWDAIGPVARWSIVAATALAFFLTGEAFVLYSPKLGRAGETFRGVGMVLLPFVAIAHDAFIQEGRAPVGYWAVVGAGLAAVYYALHRLIAPGRSSAYLAATSVAVTALLLPDVLELTADWRAPSLLLAGAGLLGVAWATDLSREPLARASRLGSMGALAESHLIVGGLAAVASAIVLGSEVDVIRPELSTIVYLAVLGLSLALTAVWQRSAWPLGAAAIAVGVLIHQIGHFALDNPTVLAWFLVVAWNCLAFLALTAAVRGDLRLDRSSTVLDGAALFYSLSAFAYACAPILDTTRPRPDGLLLVAAAALSTLVVGCAHRRRQPMLLWPAAVVAHILILDFLRLIPGETDLPVVPTSIWLVMAGAWLYASLRKRPEWAAPAWPVLFVSEALWVALFALTDGTFVSAILAGVALTVGWSVWMLANQDPVGAPAVVAQAAYALFAAWLLVELPAPVLPLGWLAASVAGIAAARLLPDGVRLAWDRSALLALGVAPVVGYVVAELGAPESAMGALDLTLAGQIALLFSLLIIGGLGWDQGRRGLVAVSVVQAYLLYAWVLVDAEVTVVQLYSAPLALMLLALAWLFAEVGEPLEGVASAVLLLPATMQAAIHDTAGYSLLLGAWGLALLALGISSDRRVLVVGGIVGLLLAALRQLWEIVHLLPPALAVGAVGLGLMAVAVLLTWHRDAVLDLGRRGGRYWDRMGRDTSR